VIDERAVPPSPSERTRPAYILRPSTGHRISTEKKERQEENGTDLMPCFFLKINTKIKNDSSRNNSVDSTIRSGSRTMSSPLALRAVIVIVDVVKPEPVPPPPCPPIVLASGSYDSISCADGLLELGRKGCCSEEVVE
jgi:hypothetical protein